MTGRELKMSSPSTAMVPCEQPVGLTRRSLLNASAAASALGAGLLGLPGYAAAAVSATDTTTAIRPFRFSFPRSALVDLRRRIDVVIPSMPGYGFSGRPTGTGWGPERMARAWDVLMKRLGYARHVAQGGDWGSVVAQAQGRQA